MSEAFGVSELLARSDRLNFPSIRFALRLILASRSNCAEVFYGDEQLFDLIGPSLIWTTQEINDIWTQCDRNSKASQPSAQRSSVDLFNLLLANDRKSWAVYREFASNKWKLDPLAIQNAFQRTLLTLDHAIVSTQTQHPNLLHVADLYKLNAIESSVLEFALATHQMRRFRDFLRLFPMPSVSAIWTNLAEMTQCPEEELRGSLELARTLCRDHLVRIDPDPDHMGEFLKLGPVATDLFSRGHVGKNELIAHLVNPIAKPILSLSDFSHLRKEIDWIVQCLHSPVGNGETGINILLVGPTGCGKTELARVLVEKSGLPGYEINSGKGALGLETEIEMSLEKLGRAQRALQTYSQAVIVFDGLTEEVKHSMNLLKSRLDATRLPTIWIGDDPEVLGDSVLRRFTYHLDIGKVSVNSRKQVASKLIQGIHVDSAKMDAIASDPAITPAQIQMAVQFARFAGGEDALERANIFFSALDAGQRIRGGAAFSQMHPGNATGWDIDALNLEASAPLPRILAALRRTGSASMAFYGTPGTGKTSLATYIAQSLNKPLICKRVSDLSSRWIGETEKCIANMFREATAENAVLLLDEGDSFLRDRRQARASWEVTQVNELLQQMETFNGVFICATNLMEDIDSAALRRFTFKVKFLPLDAPRRRRMLARFALSDADADLPRPICDRLSALSELAPGDFATIRRQEVLIDERFSLEAWITELEREHALRNPTLKKRVGFV